MEEMISGRDLIEYFARVERELSETMKDVPNAETTINLVFYILDKTIFPQERKWKEINGGD
jgi:hypothetical protein